MQWQHSIGCWLLTGKFNGDKKRKPEQATPKITWWRLKEDDLKAQFRKKVLYKVRPVDCVQ